MRGPVLDPTQLGNKVLETIKHVIEIEVSIVPPWSSAARGQRRENSHPVPPPIVQFQSVVLSLPSIQKECALAFALQAAV